MSYPASAKVCLLRCLHDLLSILVDFLLLAFCLSCATHGTQHVCYIILPPPSLPFGFGFCFSLSGSSLAFVLLLLFL